MELAAEGHALGIEIHGVNSIGDESDNPVVCSGRDIPWLQDVPAEGVWALWGVTYRDVIILDEQNEVVGVYNLTANDLQDPLKYAELKALLVAAANPAP